MKHLKHGFFYLAIVLDVIYLFFATVFFALDITQTNFSGYRFDSPPNFIAIFLVPLIFFVIPLSLLRAFFKKVSGISPITTPIIWGIAVIQTIFLTYSGYTKTWNYFNGQSQLIRREFADIDVFYQKRFDLIPMIAKTAKKLADNESSILRDIAAARAGYVQSTNIQDKLAYQNQFQKLVTGLSINIENYPNIRGDAGYLTLISTIQKTEQEMADVRLKYNDSVERYNRYANAFPYSILVKESGFDISKPYIEIPQAVKDRSTESLLNGLN